MALGPALRRGALDKATIALQNSTTAVNNSTQMMEDYIVFTALNFQTLAWVNLVLSDCYNRLFMKIKSQS
ncbi:MAG: hypothetical protein IH840_17410 [Candidatus Heimdallarchaeota archaeon]|nr:hypothetical protein [Candidatus Heimdallarchaeota archaeon]